MDKCLLAPERSIRPKKLFSQVSLDDPVHLLMHESGIAYRNMGDSGSCIATKSYPSMGDNAQKLSPELTVQCAGNFTKYSPPPAIIEYSYDLRGLLSLVSFVGFLSLMCPLLGRDVANWMK